MTAVRRRTALALAGLALLAACATKPPADAVSGRLALKVDAGADTPARSLSSAFELRGDGERGELTLSSPLGTVVARARWAPGEATLATHEGERRFDDLDALARDTFGEILPLRALPDWLQGRPWAGAADQPLQPGAGFVQLGWQIDLARFGAGQLQARRDAPPAVRLRVQKDVAP